MSFMVVGHDHAMPTSVLHDGRVTRYPTRFYINPGDDHTIPTDKEATIIAFLGLR